MPSRPLPQSVSYSFCTVQQNVFVCFLPVALPTTLLFDSFRIRINMAGFGEVAREAFFDGSGAVSNGSVVTIVGFV